MKLVQWVGAESNEWRPVGETTKALPPGCYKAVSIENMMGSQLFLASIALVLDNLLTAEDSIAKKIFDGIEFFWDRAARYKAYKLTHKRGYLVEGPPGGGKTSVCNLVADMVVKRGGVAIYSDTNTGIGAVGACIQMVRSVHPDYPILNIIEDIDVHADSDIHALLALLDGVDQVDNIIHIATTNFPDQLDARVRNRPSRFDEVIHVGSPSVKARAAYIRTTFPDMLPEDAAAIVKASDGMMFAHLKELGIATFVLGQSLKEVSDRILSCIATEREKAALEASDPYAIQYMPVKVPKKRR